MERAKSHYHVGAWKLCVFIMLLGMSSRVEGFSQGGHRIIAEIAWQQMRPGQRAYCVALLKQHPRWKEDFLDNLPDNLKRGEQADRDHWLFLHASVWPDITYRFKGRLREQYHRGPWHYVNYPIYLEPADASRIDLSRVNRATKFKGEFRDDSKLNVMQAIQANLAGLADPARSDSQRAVHLCWVMHLVGDSHQPLHSAAMFTPNVFPRGCRGGNSIRLAGKGNLHSLWDRLLPFETTLGGIGSATEKILREAGKHGPDAAQSLSPAAWIQESFGYADEFGYTRDVRASVALAEQEAIPNEESEEVIFRPSEAYSRTAGHIARRRAVEAGFRLAAVLTPRLEP